MTYNLNKRTLGASKEQLAGAYLEQKNYRILKYNFRCRIGEIDIIARDKDTMVFVEVKYRASLREGYPSDAVDYRKKRKICKVSDYYRMINGLDDTAKCRFDVVSILGDEITHYINAFEYV